MEYKYQQGETVFIVERDEWDIPEDVSGLMLLAHSGDYAILTPFQGDLETLEETLIVLAENCKQEYTTGIVVAHISDCYPDFDSAQAAMDEELSEHD